MPLRRVQCGLCSAALEVPDRPDEHFLCASCSAELLAGECSPADLVPIRLVGERAKGPR